MWERGKQLVATTAGEGTHNGEKRMALELEISNLMLKSIIFTEEINIFIETKLISF